MAARRQARQGLQSDLPIPITARVNLGSGTWHATLASYQSMRIAVTRTLYATRRVVQAACLAHAQSKFYGLRQAPPSPVTAEALHRIGQLYAIKARIRGEPPDKRRRGRQAKARPLLNTLQT